MECPHLRDSVKVNRDFIKNKKCELSTNSGNQSQNPTTNATSTTVNNSRGGNSNATNNKLWKCLGILISIAIIILHFCLFKKKKFNEKKNHFLGYKVLNLY